MEIGTENASTISNFWLQPTSKVTSCTVSLASCKQVKAQKRGPAAHEKSQIICFYSCMNWNKSVVSIVRLLYVRDHTKNTKLASNRPPFCPLTTSLTPAKHVISASPL